MGIRSKKTEIRRNGKAERWRYGGTEKVEVGIDCAIDGQGNVEREKWTEGLREFSYERAKRKNFDRHTQQGKDKTYCDV